MSNVSWHERWPGLVLLAAILWPGASRADDSPSLPSSTTEKRHQIIPHQRVGRSGAATPASSGGWWMGTAGIAAALAAFGGMSVAARRLAPGAESGPLRVVGRTSLSPKHMIYLLRAGDKTLIVGTGPQGAPTLLGEMPTEPARPPAVAAPHVRGGA